MGNGERASRTKSSAKFRQILVALAAVTSSCTEPNPAFEEPEAVCPTGEYFVGQEFTLVNANKLDVLVVVDNSPGMLDNQRAFATAMPTFVARLAGQTRYDYRIGVISSDLADQGRTQTGPAGQGDCPATLPEFVDRNTPNGAIAAGCNIVIGQDGSEFEHSFEAARQAIDTGAGFMRPDARLLVIFLSDEDDCTVASPQFNRADPSNCVWQRDLLVAVDDYARYFAQSARQFSGNPVSIVTIAGPRTGRTFTAPTQPAAACTGNGDALAAERLVAITLNDALAESSMSENICTTSFGDVLTHVFEDIVGLDHDNLCVSLPISGEPKAVLVGSADAPVEISSDGGYLQIQSTPQCANGAVALSRIGRSQLDSTRAEVRYCTATNPNPGN